MVQIWEVVLFQPLRIRAERVSEEHTDDGSKLVFWDGSGNQVQSFPLEAIDFYGKAKQQKGA